MIAVIFTLCAALQCETHRLDLPRATELQCMAVAQAELAKQAGPGWRVVRYGCERNEGN